jgi:hypothetical protein
MAELHIKFTELAPDTEVCGELVGPRCPGASTIEVAYPLRTLGHGVYRVLIPDPIFWSTQRPCVYEGAVEFRRRGRTEGTVTLSVGLRERTSKA